jgi:hypothetical protein
MDRHNWKNDSACHGMDTNTFFDEYEENPETRSFVDSICAECPVRKQCFASAVTNKGWGVWGGIYFENGKISREFNNHRSKQEWSETWKSLTLDKEK